MSDEKEQFTALNTPRVAMSAPMATSGIIQMDRQLSHATHDLTVSAGLVSISAQRTLYPLFISIATLRGSFAFALPLASLKGHCSLVHYSEVFGILYCNMGEKPVTPFHFFTVKF